jgi:SAM-dependent methyltransferase
MEEAIAIANRTARSGGAVGAGAVVPAFIRKWAQPGQAVLDFGAGPQARHTLALRDLGLSVTAHDFGANLTPGLHDPRALERTYDVVFASNVLNTAATEALLLRTLRELAGAVKPGGLALVNLPADPRKAAWPASKAQGDALLHRLLLARFGRVQRLPSGFWVCRQPLRSRGQVLSG